MPARKGFRTLPLHSACTMPGDCAKTSLRTNGSSVLSAARIYQQRELRATFSEYITASIAHVESAFSHAARFNLAAVQTLPQFNSFSITWHVRGSGCVELYTLSMADEIESQPENPLPADKAPSELLELSERDFAAGATAAGIPPGIFRARLMQAERRRVATALAAAQTSEEPADPY